MSSVAAKKMAWGKAIKVLCVENNLKQRDLAKDIGVNEQTLSAVITGRRYPDAELIVSVLIYFNMKAAELSDMTEELSND